MRSAEIRERYLSFFEERGHTRLESASLIPATFDPSVLLTTAGMQPLKPCFLGIETPPAPRLTSCQKCFRTTDIEEVGSTARHLTLFEMLGNFSIGDYFKSDAIRFAWDLSTDGFGLAAEDIWITVFAGDDELGLGPDEEAIDFWTSVGVPEERIVRLPRSDNFWQAGPIGPCGPCSELYLDRGPSYGSDRDRPGDSTERFLEYWNLVFMQYDLGASGRLEPLPARSIDTGLGLERMAAILQGASSVYGTDLFAPLVEIGEELSGRKFGSDEETTKALRVLADHGRAMVFLAADGVVPSNEDRGYILRRIIRRAVYRGRTLGIESGLLKPLAERAVETMVSAYPYLAREHRVIMRWLQAEEETFDRTLENGMGLLSELIENAKAEGTPWVDTDSLFKLHDTYGFPYDLARELLKAEGLSADDRGFHELMEEQRVRARTGSATAHGSENEHQRVLDFVRRAPWQTEFTGYESLESRTSLEALEPLNGRYLAKISESPFYPQGGGQVADRGRIETETGVGTVEDVFRVGDDQAVLLAVESGELSAGRPAYARVDRKVRHSTSANHTATHLLHAALKSRLGKHVRQAGSHVGPDKLRFDFNHESALEQSDIVAIEDWVNDRISEAIPVRALSMERSRAVELGAVALFGEKYGEWVRVVEIEDVSRELCGGTHVQNTSEIGATKILSESSSASNVRRIEALTGPEAIKLLRHRDRQVVDIAKELRVRADEAQSAVCSLVGSVGKLKERLVEAASDGAGERVDALAGGADAVAGVSVVATEVAGLTGDELLELSDRLKGRLDCAAVLLGTVEEGRVHLVANFSAGAVERGLDASDVVKIAAKVVGGGGGGRKNMARAGGRYPDRVGEALQEAARAVANRLDG